MRKTKKEIMEGIEAVESKVVANNTVEYVRNDGATVWRLHLTDIIVKRKDGCTVLNSGGWQTVTTKERMNRYLPPGGWQIYQLKNIWYLADGFWNNTDRQTWVFKDGMIIRPDGTVDNAGPSVEYLKKLQGRINTYVKGFMGELTARSLHAPNGGDCWSCGMFKAKDDHVLSHIDEKYYTGALLVNAIDEIPVSEMAKHCLGYFWGVHEERMESMEGLAKSQISKSLKRYLQRCLGLAS
jgi:hypothetical protein